MKRRNFIFNTSAAVFTTGAPALAINDRAEIEAAMQSYATALKSGTPDDIAGHYTSDGELLLPGVETLHGRAAIRQFLAPLAGAVEVASVAIATEIVTLAKGSASQWGTYTQVAAERGKEQKTYAGRYAALWRKENGKWLLARLLMQPK